MIQGTIFTKISGYCRRSRGGGCQQNLQSRSKLSCLRRKLESGFVPQLKICHEYVDILPAENGHGFPRVDGFDDGVTAIAQILSHRRSL